MASSNEVDMVASLCLTSPWHSTSLMMTSSNGSISVLLVLCAGNPPVTGGFPLQRPVTRSFGEFFDLRLNKRLSKQSGRRWFDTPSRSLWRHNTAYFSPFPTSNFWSKILLWAFTCCYIFLPTDFIWLPNTVASFSIEFLKWLCSS